MSPVSIAAGRRSKDLEYYLGLYHGLFQKYMGRTTAETVAYGQFVEMIEKRRQEKPELD
jgi:hypothetical protein